MTEKERPILFNAPMVRAILEGRKTQTRRVVKPQPAGEWAAPGKTACPYGHPGDRLWVRESGWERPERTAKMMREGADTWPRFAYAADDWSDQDRADFKAWGFKARPSIHMPRWASRITLEITGLRVESLQQISNGDVLAEGVRYMDWQHDNGECCETAREAFHHLWDSLHGPGSWDENPLVWVIEFRSLCN